MKAHYSVVMVGLLAACASSAQVTRDRFEKATDRHELRQDRREIRDDFRDLRHLEGLLARMDSARVANDLNTLSAIDHELAATIRAEYFESRAELRRDRREVRRDNREVHSD